MFFCTALYTGYLDLLQNHLLLKCQLLHLATVQVCFSRVLWKLKFLLSQSRSLQRKSCNCNTLLRKRDWITTKQSSLSHLFKAYQTWLKSHTSTHCGPICFSFSFLAPPRSFFSLNHVRKVRKRCSHSRFNFQVIILRLFDRNVGLCCSCFLVAMGDRGYFRWVKQWRKVKDQSSGKGGRTQIVQGPLQALHLSPAPKLFESKKPIRRACLKAKCHLRTPLHCYPSSSRSINGLFFAKFDCFVAQYLRAPYCILY